MIRLPHRVIYAPRMAALGGHDGLTVLWWTFTRRRQVSARFVRHEYRHAVQWTVCTTLAAALIVAAHWVVGLSLWFLPAAPLGFLAPYFLSFIPGGYRGSWFERDAERYAGRVG